MKLNNIFLSTVLLALSGFAFAQEEASMITVTDMSVKPSIDVPKEYFTGQARLDTLFQAPTPARISGAMVTFEPTARTAWHTHPYGQTLFVTAGKGWVQEWGKTRQEINVGDMVWIPEGIKHWHGASEETAMTHFAIAEIKDGTPVTWMEKVSDAQYQGKE